MNLFLTVLLAFGPTIGLTALLIGRPYLRMKRTRYEEWEVEATDPDRLISKRPDPLLLSDLQITSVLADESDVLLGYRAGIGSGCANGPATNTSPSTVGTLVLTLGRDPGHVLSVLDSWREEEVELTFRRSESTNLVVLCERGTARQLVLNQPQAP